MKVDKGVILISLTYTPKKDTLIQKFGNLPLQYTRTHLSDRIEMRLFEKALKRYKFDMLTANEEAGTSRRNPNLLKALTFHEENKNLKRRQQALFNDEDLDDDNGDNDDDDDEDETDLESLMNSDDSEKKKSKKPVQNKRKNAAPKKKPKIMDVQNEGEAGKPENEKNDDDDDDDVFILSQKHLL